MEEGEYGVYFRHEGSLRRDLEAEIRDYFSQFGKVTSVKPGQPDRVYVNFKYRNAADKCLLLADKYGNVNRGRYVSSSDNDTSSIASGSRFSDTSERGAKKKNYNSAQQFSVISELNHAEEYQCENKNVMSQLYESGNQTGNRGKYRANSKRKKKPSPNASPSHIKGNVPDINSEDTCGPPPLIPANEEMWDDMPALVPVTYFQNDDVPPLEPVTDFQYDDMPPLVPAASFVPRNCDVPRAAIPSAADEKVANQIIIGNLHKNTTVDDVYEILEDLQPFYISPIRPTNIREQFFYCVAKFRTQEQAENAVSDFNGSLLHGSRLLIERMDKMYAECRQFKLTGYR